MSFARSKRFPYTPTRKNSRFSRHENSDKKDSVEVKYWKSSRVYQNKDESNSTKASKTTKSNNKQTKLKRQGTFTASTNLHMTVSEEKPNEDSNTENRESINHDTVNSDEKFNDATDSVKDSDCQSTTSTKETEVLTENNASETNQEEKNDTCIIKSTIKTVLKAILGFKRFPQVSATALPSSHDQSIEKERLKNEIKELCSKLEVKQKYLNKMKLWYDELLTGYKEKIQQQRGTIKYLKEELEAVD